MPVTINIQGVGSFEFPDGLTLNEYRTLIEQTLSTSEDTSAPGPDPIPDPQTLERSGVDVGRQLPGAPGVAEMLPFLLGGGAALATTPFSPPVQIGAAALGGMAGEAGRQFLQGESLDPTSMAVEGSVQAAPTAIVRGLTSLPRTTLTDIAAPDVPLRTRVQTFDDAFRRPVSGTLPARTRATIERGASRLRGTPVTTQSQRPTLDLMRQLGITPDETGAAQARAIAMSLREGGGGIPPNPSRLSMVRLADDLDDLASHLERAPKPEVFIGGRPQIGSRLESPVQTSIFGLRSKLMFPPLIRLEQLAGNPDPLDVILRSIIESGRQNFDFDTERGLTIDPESPIQFRGMPPDQQPLQRRSLGTR